jgi:hypothetical protein
LNCDQAIARIVHCGECTGGRGAKAYSESTGMRATVSSP